MIGYPYLRSGTIAGQNYTDRGDSSSADYDENDVTKDSAYHSLDLSSIVGIAARLVLIRVQCTTTAAAKYFALRTNGNSNTICSSIRYTQVANVPFGADMWAYTDENGVIEYAFESATGSSIFIHVRGWWE